jgi:hypothetical protein
MAEDQDLASLLPRAPPCAPARREAAIEAALRRFDGDPVTGPSQARGAVQQLRQRPRFGAALAACLLVAIGLPLALVTEDDRMRSIDPRAAPASESQAVDARSATVARPAAPVPPAAPAISSAGGAPADGAEAGSAPVPNSGEAGAAPEREAVAEATPVSNPGALAPVAPPPPAPAQAPPSAPPSAAAPLANTEVSATSRSLDSTADAPRARTGAVLAGAVRGFSIRDARPVAAAPRQGIGAPTAETACTIDDPYRSLARCAAIDAAAPGSAGLAAARIADGLNHAWQGNLPAARQAFDQALAADPRSSLAYLNRGLVRERQGDLAAAQADFVLATKLSPGSAQARYHLERARRNAGSGQPGQGK